MVTVVGVADIAERKLKTEQKGQTEPVSPKWIPELGARIRSTK